MRFHFVLTCFLFLIVACSLPNYDISELEGVVRYTIVRTPADEINNKVITLEQMTFPNGNIHRFQVMPQTGLGWLQLGGYQNYYNNYCPYWTKDNNNAVFTDGVHVTIYNNIDNTYQTIQLDYSIIWNVVLSPDKSKLAFIGSKTYGEGFSLWIVELSQQISPLHVECEYCQSFTWRPDGKALAYTDYYQEKIIILDTSTWQPVDEYEIAPYDFGSPTQGRTLDWSPDGNLLAYTAGEFDSSHIFTLNLSTRKTTQVSPPNLLADSPSWSPNGKNLLFRLVRPQEPSLPSEEPWTEETDLAVVSSDGKKFGIIAAQKSEDNIFACPQWLEN